MGNFRQQKGAWRRYPVGYHGLGCRCWQIDRGSWLGCAAGNCGKLGHWQTWIIQQGTKHRCFPREKLSSTRLVFWGLIWKVRGVRWGKNEFTWSYLCKKSDKSQLPCPRQAVSWVSPHLSWLYNIVYKSTFQINFLGLNPGFDYLPKFTGNFIIVDL